VVYLLFERNTRRVQQAIRQLQSGRTGVDAPAARTGQGGTTS
jgi:hypothetical protein